MATVALGGPSRPAEAQTGYPPPITPTPPSGPVPLVPLAPSGPSLLGGAAPPLPDGLPTVREGGDRLPVRRTGRLELARRAVRPGEAVVARGGGCAAFDGVTFSVDDTALGAARADAAGEFEVILTFPALAPGRHRVVAQCGDVTGEASVDVVISTTGSPPALFAAAAVVLCFLVLVGAVLSEGRGARDESPQGVRRR